MEQGRQKREVDEAEFHSPPSGGVATPCANNCGFFGSSATDNLCSRCYKDAFLSGSKVPVEAALAVLQGGAETKGGGGGCGSPEFEVSEGGSSAGAAEGFNKDPNRCGSCNKRVGLMGFRCRCGGVFCSQHRYSDKHECGYDYRQAGKEAVSKANPIVKLDKVTKI